MKTYLKDVFFADFMASIVVFLVALPLCMGIAIASGVDPIIGLLSGIIGGVVVGTFAGSPLQVSGPAAGLAVMVFQYIEKFGIESLVPLGIIVGIVQVLMYKFKLAQYFRAISPALIKGMLAGIGLLILISQIHIALGTKPGGNGLLNITSLPSKFMSQMIESSIGHIPMLVAISTVLLIFGWLKFAPKLSKKVPAPLFAIVIVSTISSLFLPSLSFVSIPTNIFSELNFVGINSFSNISLALVISAIAIAVVASAESLLCVSATDKISGKESNYGKEIFAQGLGNVFAGFVGALPITGVIVRSSANIESGGRTRGSAIMHGVWLLALVFFFPQILELVPIAALAGILIFTGLKLLDLKSIPALVKENQSEAVIFFITLGLIVAMDLLTGVIIGFGASLIVLMLKTIKLDIEHKEEDETIHLRFNGKATFLHIPKVAGALQKADNGKQQIVIDLSNLQYVDEVIKDEITNWKNKMEGKAKKATIHLPVDRVS